MSASITYYRIDGYKYQLLEDYSFETGFEIEAAVRAPGDWVRMSRAGRLRLKRGYAWDGPSGPALDTPDLMRGSLIHDALYQLMREELLPRRLRKAVDVLLWQICLADGMSQRKADYVYHAVRTFGAPATRPRKPRSVLTAP